MNNYKKDFPIFENNNSLIFLDSGASSQKPKIVIDGTSDFLKKHYANIHRGNYSLSKHSEYLFNKSKKKVAKFINAKSEEEIIYTYNSTYAFNMLAQILCFNGKLKKGDKVLLGISEHHANIVPWQILQKQFKFEIEFINLDKNFEIDIKDFEKKYTDDVKVISLQHISNTTGSLNPILEISKKIKKNTYFILDGSQSIPHLSIDVQKLGCDFFIFTGHKIMAETGIGVLRGKKSILKSLSPVWGGGDMIKIVDKKGFTESGIPTKFEPGTPNIIGAISLLRALEYIENIGGIQKIHDYEKELVKYTLLKLEKFQKKYPDIIKLIGKNTVDGRIGVFSFHTDIMPPKSVGNIMAENNICIRTGGHCTHPLMKELGLKNGTFRMSLYIYNNKNDIDAFFNILKEIGSFGKTLMEESEEDMC